MAGRAASSPRDLLDSLRAFIPRARGALWIGAAVFCLGLLGTAAWVRSTTRLYRSEATIIYEPSVLQGEAGSPREIGLALQRTLTAAPRLQRLIEEMHLYRTVVGRSGLAVAVDEMRAHIKVTVGEGTPVGEGTAFDVSYDADDGDRARAVLERLVGGVVDEDAQRRQHEAEANRSILDGQRRQAEQDLQDKQARLAAFSAQHPQQAADSSVRVADSPRAGASADEVGFLELRSAEIEQRLARAAGQPPAAAPGPAPAADPAIVAARAQIAADLLVAERDLNDKQTRLPYEHPDIKIALRRVADERTALRKADDAVAASAAAATAPASTKATSAAEVASLQRALASVRARIAELKAQVAAETPRAVEASPTPDTAGTRLAQEVSEAQQRRREVEAQLFQSQLLSTLGRAGQGGGLVVSERSYQASRPIAGHQYRVALLGASMSVLLALLSLLVAGRLDEHLYDARDVERALGPDVVVVVPRLGMKLLARSPAGSTESDA
jgi:uncharacterized protein involved in exopolysaccharide biosynthesis